MLLWYASISPIRRHVCLPYSITLWYPHISPYSYVMVPSYITMLWVSLAYTTYPTSHLAAYMAIAITKGTLWCPQP